MRLDTTIKTSKEIKEALKERYPELNSDPKFTYHKLMMRELLGTTTIARTEQSNKFNDVYNRK